MSHPQVINEVASAITAVINVIAVSVLKVLPALVIILICLAAIDVFVGSLLEGETQTEKPFLSENAEIQLSSNTAVETSTVNEK